MSANDDNSADSIEPGTWIPQQSDTSHKRCQNCGAHVSDQFRRVFSDQTGRVNACVDCATYPEIRGDRE